MTPAETYRKAAFDLATAKTTLYRIEQEIESVTERITELAERGADRDDIIRARDKRRHLRDRAVEAYAEVERLNAVATVARLEWEEEQVDGVAA